MNKFLIYTSNLRECPRTMEDVIRFAKETPKFRISNVELNSSLASVRPGDHIITKKGNAVYVIRTFDKSLEDLSKEDRDYIDELQRTYGMKSSNITGVSNIIRFESWCHSAKPFVKSQKTDSKMEKNTNSIKNLSARLREKYMPTEAKDVRIAQDGNICVETRDGYVAIDAEGNLTSYPVELTLALPVFIMSKPKDQIVEGDVICRDNKYYKVTSIAGGTLKTVGYNGVGHAVHTVTDFILGATERVVASLVGNLGGGINPMLLLAMSGEGEDKGFDSLLPLLMMSQNGSTIGANPMLLLALAGDGDGKGLDFKSLAMMSMLGGGNIFGGNAATPAGGLFGGLFGAAPAAAAPAAKPAKKKTVKKAAAPAAAAPAGK